MSGLLKRIKPCIDISIRNYAFKSNLKIKWVRPEKIPSHLPAKSGDCSKLPPIEKGTLIPFFEGSKELESGDDRVKSLFEIQNNKRRYMSEHYGNSFVRQVQRHPLDFGSIEAKIAKMTSKIRYLQDRMAICTRDKKTKITLNEMIDKRKKFLKYVRRWDYQRFEWLLEKLDLVYKPPPNEFHWITRKDSLRKLTNIHCEKIKEDRLTEYRNLLQSQQLDFLESKLKNLKFIRSEQIECKVNVTVSEDEINSVQEQLNDLKKQRDLSEEEISSY